MSATETAELDEHRASLVNRLKRVRGQVDGVERMVREGRYCIDILTQIAAARSALRAAGFELLDSHVHSCVGDAIRSGDQELAEARSEELIDAVRRFAKDS